MENPHSRPGPHSGEAELHSYDPLRPHSHDPNPAPPSETADFLLSLPDGSQQSVTPDDLSRLPQATVPDCYIISTGHGTSGPFAFSGVAFVDFVRHFWAGEWSEAEAISGDGFGTRLATDEVKGAVKRPILLAIASDSQPLRRAAGLVRLIVPSEIDDALKQVKWIGRVNIFNAEAQGRGDAGKTEECNGL